MPPGAGREPGQTGDWSERVPLDVLRRRAADVGIEGADRLGREDLVAALNRERPSNRRDPIGETGDQP